MCAGEENPLTDGYEGLKVLKILELAEKSIINGMPITYLSENKNYFSHETAIIDDGVEIGKDTKNMAF